jgi:hypothetical protein
MFSKDSISSPIIRELRTILFKEKIDTNGDLGGSVICDAVHRFVKKDAVCPPAVGLQGGGLAGLDLVCSGFDTMEAGGRVLVFHWCRSLRFAVDS